MPERFTLPARRPRSFKTALLLLSAITVALGAAACTDEIEGGAACPALCPSRPNAFRDTTIDVVDFDTTVSGFPTFGLSPSLLLANRKDTVETSAVVRFDSLPSSFTPNNVGDTVTISTVDSVYLRVVIDSTGARGPSQVELQAFDVDTTDAASVPATLSSLFRPDRLIGTLPITTVAARDTVRIPLSNAVLQRKLASRSRLRIGLRLSGSTSAQVRIVAFSSGFASPLLTFDPASDTLYLPRTVSASTTRGGSTTEELLAVTVFSIATRGTAGPVAQTLLVGGLPSRRSYLRFNVPPGILDSSTVVRAELLLTQLPSTGVDLGDTLSVVPLLGVSTSAITDIRRAMDLATGGYFVAGSFLPFDSLRVLPRDGGTKSLNVLRAVTNWAALPKDIPRVLVLRSSDEGAQPAEVRFYSSKAAAALRPRLRLTYLPRVDGTLP